MKKIRLNIISSIHDQKWIEKRFPMEGYLVRIPIIGHEFRLKSLEGYGFELVTTDVIEIIDPNTFKTRNTTYKFEEI